MSIRRHLLIGGVGLVEGRVRNAGQAMVSICDELEPRFESSAALKDAPFSVVSLILRFGGKRTPPQIGRIDRAHSELPVAVELPMTELRALGYADLRAVFRDATLEALVAVADKFGLARDPWIQLRGDANSGPQ